MLRCSVAAVLAALPTVHPGSMIILSTRQCPMAAGLDKVMSIMSGMSEFIVYEVYVRRGN